MKKLMAIVLIIFAVQLNAQQKRKKVNLTFGTGISLLGTGDMVSVNFENELNYCFNDYFSGSVILNYGRSNNGVFETTSFIQGNLNIYFSPFRNSRKNDFKAGTGFSLMNVSDSYYDYGECGNNSGNVFPYHFDKRNSTGINIIVEDTYSVNNLFLVGLKLFTQPYSNGDINSGILLKFGVKL